MFNKGDEVVVKSLDELLNDNLLVKAQDLENVYYNNDIKFVVFSDFPYYDKVATVDEIDKKDKDIPYFLSIGIWVPEFMIKSKEEEKLEPKQEEIDVDKVKVEENLPEQNAKQKEVIINKFNNKPFGELFCKLIKLDPKVAEFSNTTFSKLLKHELQYIAKILEDHGAEHVNYNKLKKEELAVHCYKETVKL